MPTPPLPPLRLLRVVHTLRRESGGPSESVLRSTEALVKSGHHVEIATADAPGTPAPASAPFPFHPLGGHDERTMGAWVKTHHARFDAVLVHGLWQTGWAIRRALRGSSTPYLLFPHGMLDPWFRRNYPLKHLKKQLYWWLREGRVLSDAAAVCFTCDEERRLARQTFFPYDVKERVVSYGTAGPPADLPDQAAEFIRQFPALAGSRFLLFLGRIHHKKGVSELITAYARFRHDHADAPVLVIAGPCENARYAAELRQLADQSGLPQLDLTSDPRGVSPSAGLIWLPMLADDLKWGAFHASEAFILPSHQENFGIAVAEALACGRPVLISDKVNIWREIAAAGAGLVGADSVNGVTDLLTRWMAFEPSVRETMGLAATGCFAQNFEITNAARSLVQVVRDCVQS
jgi:glycosyltransferase involved in cell wall biosynthesis